MNCLLGLLLSCCWCFPNNNQHLCPVPCRAGWGWCCLPPREQQDPGFLQVMAQTAERLLWLHCPRPEQGGKLLLASGWALG